MGRRELLPTLMSAARPQPSAPCNLFEKYGLLHNGKCSDGSQGSWCSELLALKQPLWLQVVFPRGSSKGSPAPICTANPHRHLCDDTGTVCTVMVRLIHHCISVRALCGAYVQNTCWMRKWMNSFWNLESLSPAVICEHIRIYPFTEGLTWWKLNMNVSGRQAQVKPCVWHLQAVQPWESYLSPLSFPFLLFKIVKLIIAIS